MQSWESRQGLNLSVKLSSFWHQRPLLFLLLLSKAYILYKCHQYIINNYISILFFYFNMLFLLWWLSNICQGTTDEKIAFWLILLHPTHVMFISVHFACWRKPIHEYIILKWLSLGQKMIHFKSNNLFKLVVQKSQYIQSSPASNLTHHRLRASVLTRQTQNLQISKKSLI